MLSLYRQQCGLIITRWVGLCCSIVFQVTTVSTMIMKSCTYCKQKATDYSLLDSYFKLYFVRLINYFGMLSCLPGCWFFPALHLCPFFPCMLPLTALLISSFPHTGTALKSVALACLWDRLHVLILCHIMHCYVLVCLPACCRWLKVKLHAVSSCYMYLLFIRFLISANPGSVPLS